jgi:hypothetical protein
MATELQEADISESLSALEKDLDSLLQLDGSEATARRGLRVVLMPAIR